MTTPSIKPRLSKKYSEENFSLCCSSAISIRKSDGRYESGKFFMQFAQNWKTFPFIVKLFLSGVWKFFYWFLKYRFFLSPVQNIQGISFTMKQWIRGIKFRKNSAVCQKTQELPRRANETKCFHNHIRMACNNPQLAHRTEEQDKRDCNGAIRL